MSRSVKLNHRTWDAIFAKIKTDYPPSVSLIRDKMKSVLGFTVREHVNYRKDFNYNTIDWRDERSEIHLDFYDEPKRTMFLLKYSEFLNETHR
jgi:hypothetical protein